MMIKWLKKRLFSARRLWFSWMYFGSPPWDTGITPPELMAFIAENSPGRALDIGCGTGTNVITLAKHGWKVEGVDFVSKAVRIAKRKARQVGVKAVFRVGDASHLKGITGPFDLITDIGCFHSLPAAGKMSYVARVSELLGPEGTLLLYGFYHPEGAGNSINDDMIWILTGAFELVSREEGVDGQRKSIWLTLRKESSG